MLDSRKKREKEVYNNLKGRGESNYYAWNKELMASLYSVRHKFHNVILNNYIRGKKILIIGCGKGHGTDEMLKRGAASVTGIDLSERMIELARSNYSSSKTFFTEGDAENTPFKNNSFDVVYCKAILHHLDTPKALKEIRRVLVSHGYLYVADECGLLNPIAWIRRRVFPSEIHTLDEHPFIPYFFRKDLSREGFQEICFEYQFIISPLAPVLAKVFPSINWSSLLRVLISIDRVLTRTPIKQLSWRIGGLFKKSD